jgi:hypothetical protein
MRRPALAIALSAAMSAFFLVPSLVSAQTQTQTNCSVNGNQVNCTSTSDGGAASAAAASASAQEQKDIDEGFKQLGDAIGAAIANKKADKHLEEQVTMLVVGCNQNPSRHVMLSATSEKVTCDEYISRVAAICAISPKYGKLKFCKAIPKKETAPVTAGAR